MAEVQCVQHDSPTGVVSRSLHVFVALALTHHRSTFTPYEKKNYIQAVQCMSKLPPKTPKEKCPGCRNRFDDFLATHINQTFAVRNSSCVVRVQRY